MDENHTLMLVPAVSAYVNINAIFARISIRAVVTNLLNRKAATTSYPNADDDQFIKLLAKSRECPNSNGAAPETVWITLYIRGYNRIDYYKMFSAVFQEFSLLAGTIAANAAQNDVEIDIQRVKECVEKAGLCDKIESLPDGYDTYLNRAVYEEATALSGGETQRLMLARALYNMECPDSLCRELLSAIRQNQGGTGWGLHRLSSCKFCDKIAVFHEGAVIQQGAHASLAADESGKYYELWSAQTQYYTK